MIAKNFSLKNNLPIRGISLLELMLSLAIIAILLVSAMRYYQSTRSAQQVNEAITMVQTATGAIDNWFWTFKQFKGTPNGDISTTALIKMNLLPNDFASKTANPWGGEISIETLDNSHVKINLTNIPSADCLNLREIMQKRQLQASCPPNKEIFYIVYPSAPIPK